MIGQTVGPYRIISKLGEGGMGEVYRARDTSLNRDVAIKVLPELVAGDPDRLARFTREAQTLAALNHPNIAAIYSIEERAIVMELVEGDDLSDVIVRDAGSKADAPGGIPLNDALAIGRQIIDALEAAHDIGIVHRDLKPANIKVRHDGTVKVLDFGLAKALGQEASGAAADAQNSPTFTARATQMGVIMGTAAYMSPEQARGRAVDRRTDVWAFGCVLYEMLTGRKAFDGEDATEIISSVVKSEPDWNALPASVPAHVRTIVTRCLVKDRKARIPDLSVVRYMLDGTIAAPDMHAPATAPGQAGRSSRLWPIATAVFVLATAAAGFAWYRAVSVAPTVARFIILPPDNQAFTAGGRPFSTVPVISPDGRTVAFTAQDTVGKRLIWVRPVDSLTAQSLAGTDGAAYPFWSPDSRFLGYAIQGKLLKVAASGGPVSPLCNLNPGITSRGGTWSRDNVIIFNNGPAPLYRVSSSGGDATPIGKLVDGETGRQFPSFLPDGRHYLYNASGSEEKSGLFVASIDGGDPKRLMSASTGAVYDSNSRHLLFVRQGTLVAQPFDLKTLGVAGEPFPVAERVESFAVPGLVAFSVSESGTLAYGIGEAAGAGFQLKWVDRTGKVIGTVGPEAQYRGISISPNGAQIAAHRHDGEGGDIWVTDVADGKTVRLTFDAAQENSSPVWSPQSDRIAYASTRNGKVGISVRSADNTVAEERLFESSTIRMALPQSWSPDGNSLLFAMPGSTTATDQWVVPVSGDHKPVARLNSPFTESQGQFSPDGRWLAYTSNETGVGEVYVQPAAAGSGKWPVSTGGGAAPRWRGDSHELFYVAPGKMWSVPVSSEGTAFKQGAPKPLFDYLGASANLGHLSHYSYAVSKDGQRFLIPTRKAGAEAATTQSPIVVVTNWFDAIRK